MFESFRIEMLAIAMYESFARRGMKTIKSWDHLTVEERDGWRDKAVTMLYEAEGRGLRRRA